MIFYINFIKRICVYPTFGRNSEGLGWDLSSLLVISFFPTKLPNMRMDKIFRKFPFQFSVVLSFPSLLSKVVIVDHGYISRSLQIFQIILYWIRLLLVNLVVFQIISFLMCLAHGNLHYKICLFGFFLCGWVFHIFLISSTYYMLACFSLTSFGICDHLVR